MRSTESLLFQGSLYKEKLLGTLKRRREAIKKVVSSSEFQTSNSWPALIAFSTSTKLFFASSTTGECTKKTGEKEKEGEEVPLLLAGEEEKSSTSNVDEILKEAKFVGSPWLKRQSCSRTSVPVSLSLSFHPSLSSGYD